MNQREIAYQILLATLKDGVYTNLSMKKELNALPVGQRAFVTDLVNGVLRHYYELCYQFEKDVKRISLEHKILLAMAMYERFYRKEKDYVVNNEYVNLVQKKHEKSFLNAVLRKHTTYREVEGKEEEKYSILYSLPLWMVKLLKKQYDEKDFQSILEDLLKVPPVFYRLNQRRCKKEDLSHFNLEWYNNVVFTSKENLLASKEFKEGFFYVQDINSAKIVEYLDLNENVTLLDVCSAPGTKLFNCLDVVKGENAYCNDLHAHRVELIKKTSQKLGFEGIHFYNEDARHLKDVLPCHFDRILLDVPCSGMGVLKRKPDLRYHIEPKDLDDLEVLQSEILESVAPLLKEEGILVYSTCTINRKENSGQITKFLKRHPEFELVEDQTILHKDNGDSFYLAKLKKIKESIV